MKIVFTSIFRPGLGGGAGRVAHELAYNFSLTHDVVMICPADKTGYGRDENGLPIYGISSAGDTEFQMPNLSSRTVRNLFDFLDNFQPDIVHAHEPALMGLIGQVWARMNNVPFVHTTHILPSKAMDFGTSEAIHIPAVLLRNSVSEYAVHSVLSNFFINCDALVALNQPALESIRDFGYKGPIFVIPNGRSLSHYNQYPFADNTTEQKVLVFIGFISDRKNQSYLLKTLRALPDSYHLRLIGRPLNPDYQKKLENYCQKHNLTNVEFIGQLDHSKIPDYLAGAHVFPSASKMEVQSLVVIEALASGTPVVGLSNETIDELVNEDVGAWLAKDQGPEAFAEQIQRICNLPADQYQKVCQAARDRVSHLDWSNVVDSTLSAYQEILKTRPLITEEKYILLTSLVNFFTRGDLRDYLLEVIDGSKHRMAAASRFKPRFKVPSPIRPWTRVPSSTWLLSGLTIVVSAIGFIFMKGWGNKKE